MNIELHYCQFNNLYNMRLTKIFLIIAMLFANNLFAQNVIKGTVLNENNVPVEGANVFIPMLVKGTTTSSRGEFELNNLPNGRFDLQVSHIGYANQIVSINLVGEEVNINVKLTHASIEAEAVVVSAGYNTTQHQNAVKIDILRLNERHRMPSPNVMEMLTNVPGVDMISKGNGVTKPVIRGLSMNDVLVLSNGIRFENYQYSSHHPLGIDEFGIESVEVIKGPASLLYGSDAIGGVLNFIKERPAAEGKVEGDYNLQLFSNSLGMVNNIGIKASGSKFHGGARFGQKTHADYLQGGGAFVPNSRFNEHSVKLNGGFNGKLMTTNFFYDFNLQNLGLVEEEAINEIAGRGRKPSIFYQQLGTHLVSSQSKIFLGKTKVDVNASLQSTELTHLGEPNEYELQMRLTTLIYEAKVLLPSSPGNDYIFGAQGINQWNTNINNRETILLPNALTLGYSLFGLAQQTVGKFRFQAGLRFDAKKLESDEVGIANQPNYRPSVNRMFDNITGSVGATYRGNENLIFRLNGAAAYRNPNLAELTSNGPHEARYEIGDIALKPEKSFEYDVSAHYHIDNLLVDVAGFFNSIANYIYIAPTGLFNSGLPEYRYKQDDAYLYGGEFALHFHPKSVQWIHFGTNYSYVLGKNRDGDYLPFIPASKLAFETGFMGNKLGFFSNPYFLVKINSAFPQNNIAGDETTTPGYVLVNLSLGASFSLGNQPLELNLAIQNLLDKKYVDHLSTLKEVDFYNPGRNISLTLRIPFQASIF